MSPELTPNDDDMANNDAVFYVGFDSEIPPEEAKAIMEALVAYGKACGLSLEYEEVPDESEGN